jgi:hypothetical protein
MSESFRNRKPRSAEALAKQSVKEKALWLDAGYRARQSASHKRMWADLSPEARAARLKPMLETLTPEKLANNRRLAASPEAKAKRSVISRRLWADENFRNKTLLAQRIGMAKIDRKVMGAHISASWTPERRAAQAERMKRVRQNRTKRPPLNLTLPLPWSE